MSSLTEQQNYQFRFKGAHDRLLFLVQVVCPNILLVGDDHQRLVGEKRLDVVEQTLLRLKRVT